MKRLLLILVIALVPFIPSAAQLLGDGSLAHPWSGTLAGDLTVTGTKYFNGNIYVDNETLTFAPGAKFIAVIGSATINVINTGRIVASGYSATPITFTCDPDKDGITAEPDEWWGNITITSTNTNQFNYCIFEKGRKDHFKFGQLGGGLRLGSSSVTVTNSLFHNCLAIKGGAIAVTGGASPVITACTFTSNSALNQGGAIYAEAGSAPQIINCLFNGNMNTSLTLKGGTIASLASSPQIVNSTIVNSSSPVNDGTSIYLENSPGALVLNSVIWGGATNHIGLSGTSPTVLQYNAIEGASFPGNINLNSTNTAPDGPNFTNPAGADFSITYKSPMRDNGAETWPGLTIPTKDIRNTKRIHIPDRGAYEALYSRWNGSMGTSWSTPKNWDSSILPGTMCVIIPGGLANYPTAVPGPSFTLNAGLEMNIEPGARVTFTSLTNNGTIRILSDATGIASVMTNSYSGASGSLDVKLFLTGSSTADLWHYITPPVTVSKTVFTNIDPENLLSYDESKVVTDLVEGWQWHDGYDGTTSFTNLLAKKGYDVSVLQDTSILFSNLKSMTTSLGQFNLPFSGSGGDTSLYGYSLLGNSLTCGINWDLVSYSHDNTLLRHAYYLRTATGEEASYVNGVGTNGATAHIAPLQGFFVRTRATGTYIIIPDNAREHNAAPRFKSSEQIPLISLTLSSASGHDETVIRFDPDATTGFDDPFDAAKPFSRLKGLTKIYSETGSENFSINTIPWPEKQTAVPLILEVPEEGTLRITGTRLQALDGCRPILFDNLTGSRTDLLKNAEYSFQATAGTISGRFFLEIIPSVKQTVAIAEVNKTGSDEESSLKIWSASERVCILPQGSGWDGINGKVRIFDITGRVILLSDNLRFNEGEIMEFHTPGTGGLLIIEVLTGQKRYLEKIVLAK